MENGEITGMEPGREYTREEVAEFLRNLSGKPLDRDGLYLHCLIGLNHLLSLPNVNELFDEELKTEARDLWKKIKARGLELVDPPLLFGQPE